MDTINHLSILLFCLGIGLLVIALITYMGDLSLIRTMKFKMVKVKDKRLYAKFLGKMLALIGTLFILWGLLQMFFNPYLLAIFMVIILLITFIYMAKESKKFLA